MADMDGFKEASAYGLDQPQKNKSFFLKGNENRGWGIKNRLSRIFNPKTGNTVMLACDHGFIMGPTSGLERVDLSINPLIEYADCLMCTRGILRSVIPPTMSKPVCLRSDGGTTILTDLNLNRVYDVEDVIRMNVSAMAVMVFSPPDIRLMFCSFFPGGCAMISMPDSSGLFSSSRRSSA